MHNPVMQHHKDTAGEKRLPIWSPRNGWFQWITAQNFPAAAVSQCYSQCFKSWWLFQTQSCFSPTNQQLCRPVIAFMAIFTPDELVLMPVVYYDFSSFLFISPTSFSWRCFMEILKVSAWRQDSRNHKELQSWEKQIYKSSKWSMTWTL